MSLEQKSKELKELVSTYDTKWFLGDLSFLMNAIPDGRAQDQLGKLSSPLRQIYYLGGLLITSDDSNADDIQFTHDKWNKIVELLNAIEFEYDKLFFPKPDEEITEEWKKVREVAVPSFLSYFNQGPLNYEEQTLNWIKDLYSQFDELILAETGLTVNKFIQFYEYIDKLIQDKFQGFTTNKEKFKKEWLSYTDIEMGVVDGVPDFIKEKMEENRALFTFMSDKGIKNRFKIKDIVSDDLNEDEIKTVLSSLSHQREDSDFLYYTSTKPGNPLFEKPIIDIGNDLYQVFEVKQIAHAIDELFENICSKDKVSTTKLVEKKGKLLEDRIVELFEKFLKSDFKKFTSYYVDGCEQDILFLWKNHAFIIEAKGYNLREPFRDPNKAFVRIKDDFKSCIGYGYKQTKRVEEKFVNQVPLRIEDKNGNLIEEIDTTKYDTNDFSIIVNLKSFGQIQNDLSALLEIEEDDVFPWVVKLDDLEVFFLTMIAQKKKPEFFVDFLVMREDLHGKLICSDELEVCGGYLEYKLKQKDIEKAQLIKMNPDSTEIFDSQYRKEMGFKNEKYLKEKRSGKYIFF